MSDELQSTRKVKLVLLGDGAVGKTSILIRFAAGSFPVEYIPTVFDQCSHRIQQQDGVDVELDLNDTAGGQEYEDMWPSVYPGTSIFLLCFSCASRASFDRIKTRYLLAELKRHMPDTPFVLVATKIDLRDDVQTLERLQQRGESLVSFEEGDALANDIGAAAYCETSALNGFGVSELFQKTAKISIDPSHANRRRKKSCMIV